MFKKYRKLRNYTQEELSFLCNLDLRTIQRIENNERTPSIKTLRTLIKVLNIEDKDILNYLKKNK